MLFLANFLANLSWSLSLADFKMRKDRKKTYNIQHILNSIFNTYITWNIKKRKCDKILCTKCNHVLLDVLYLCMFYYITVIFVFICIYRQSHARNVNLGHPSWKMNALLTRLKHNYTMASASPNRDGRNPDSSQDSGTDLGSLYESILLQATQDEEAL